MEQWWIIYICTKRPLKLYSPVQCALNTECFMYITLYILHRTHRTGMYTAHSTHVYYAQFAMYSEHCPMYAVQILYLFLLCLSETCVVRSNCTYGRFWSAYVLYPLWATDVHVQKYKHVCIHLYMDRLVKIPVVRSNLL